LSRGLLDATDMERISREVPDLSDLGDMVFNLPPDFLSISSPPESDIPVASVCFQDAFNTSEEAVYALREVFAHQLWYREREKPPNKMAAAFFGRFYADDATLRLYSAGEHLANGIIMMLEIGDNELKPYKQQGKRISQQSVVGNYLRKEKTNHPITKEVIRLADSNEWQATMRYRNRRVHEQPPTVAGMGIVYKRGKRWKPLPNGRYTLGIGGGDKPEFDIKDLIRFIQPAMFQFTETSTSGVKYYTELLKDAGKQTVQPPDKGES